MLVRLSLTPNRLAMLLSLVVAGLLLANLICIVLQNSGHTFHTMSIFYFNREGNLPSVYSAMAIFLCAFLFWINGNMEKIKKRERTYWRIFAAVFLFLGIDELVSIHETFTDNAQELLGGFTAGGYLHFAWIIPYCLMLGILVAVMIPFLRRLPSKMRSRLFMAGIVFITGAVGMEALGGNYVFDRGDASKEELLYGLLVTCEELFEMAGIIMLAHALFAYRIENTRNRLMTLRISCQPDGARRRARVPARILPEKTNGTAHPPKRAGITSNAGKTLAGEG